MYAEDGDGIDGHMREGDAKVQVEPMDVVPAMIFHIEGPGCNCDNETQAPEADDDNTHC